MLLFVVGFVCLFGVFFVGFVVVIFVRVSVVSLTVSEVAEVMALLSWLPPAIPYDARPPWLPQGFCP